MLLWDNIMHHVLVLLHNYLHFLVTLYQVDLVPYGVVLQLEVASIVLDLQVFLMVTRLGDHIWRFMANWRDIFCRSKLVHIILNLRLI